MEDMMEIELREVPGLEVRAEEDGEGVVIAGRGIPYGEWSEDLGGFRERIMPGAFRESIADDDIRALYNHNPDIVLGRQSTGTLRLDDQPTGLMYEVDVNPDDADAVSAVARVRRGDVAGNSFGFWISEREDQEWEERDGIMWRTIRRARLRELGPQTFPAYPQSDVSVRSAEAVVAEAREILASPSATPTPTEAERELRALELDEQDAAPVLVEADLAITHNET